MASTKRTTPMTRGPRPENAPAKRAPAKRAPAKSAPAKRSPPKRSPANENAAAKITAPSLAAGGSAEPHDAGPATFRSRFEAMDRSLRARGDVRVLAPARLVTSPVNARMTRVALEQLEESSGVSTNELAPYAPHLFGTVLHWLGPANASGLHPLGGEVRLQSVGALARPFDPAPGWRLFDDHPGSGDGVLTLLRPHEGRWQLGVYEDGVVEPMDVDVRGYLDALVDLRAMFGFPFLFVCKSRHHAALGARLDALGALLGLDVSTFRARVP